MRWPNDWRIRGCLLLCGSIVLAQLLLTVSSAAGFEIPVLHQVTGFVFLTLVPGILLLRILKVHNINLVESAAYSVGLSLAAVMFSCAAVNFLLPLAGIAQPLTLFPLLIILSVESAMLMAIAWLRDSSFTPQPTSFKWPSAINAALSLLGILLLIILGVRISDTTGSNLALIISILLIAGVICLAALKKFITPEIYPAALFIIALGLLYQTTLMSPFLIGSDIFTEYHYYLDAAANGIWNHTLPNPVNSCLSIVMLAPAYSLLMRIDGLWVFKAVYPLIFSVAPLILFRAFKFQIGDAPAFFAVFFFMSVPTFSLEMISLCRQQVAEVFLALTILLFAEGRLSFPQKMTMLIIFSISIAVSHYSMGFITMGYFLLLIPVFLVIRSRLFLRIWRWLTSRTGGLPSPLSYVTSFPLRLLIIPAASYVVCLLAWYWLIASAANLYFISHVLHFQVSAVSTEVVNGTGQSASSTLTALGSRPDLIKAALGLDFMEATLQGKIFRILQYLTQFLLIAGCFRLLISPHGLRFRGIHIALSVISAGMLAACIILPGFAGILNATRWYHISLITLAPFAVIGAESLFMLASFILRRKELQHPLMDFNGTVRPYLACLALVVLVPYFIFTSGVVFELTGQQDLNKVDSPYSIALSSHRLDIMGVFNLRDSAAVTWIAGEGDKDTPVYADDHALKLFSLYDYPCKLMHFTFPEMPAAPSYIFFTSWNNGKDELAFASMGKPGMRDHVRINDIPGLANVLDASNTVYVNGGARLLSLGK